jgi:predicted PurR-regulated permease PerM
MVTQAVGRATLTVLALIALVLTVVVIRPFGGAIFMAAVLAGASFPLYARLTALLRGRRNLSSAIVTIGVVIAILLPLAWVAAVLVKEVAQAVAWVRSALEAGGVDALISYLPNGLQTRLREFLDALPEVDTFIQRYAGRVPSVVGAVGDVLSATFGALLQLVAWLIAFFFLLTDGPRLVSWLERAIPLEPGRFRELLDAFRRVTRAVLMSTLATAVIQSLVALAGYLLARVPQPVFFSVITFVFALVPAVGAAFFVVAVAAVLLATGHPVAAIFLGFWGLFVVGLIDNVAKPYLIRGGTEIHGVVVFFALLGGLAALGPVGLVAGPLIVAFLLAVVRIYSRDNGHEREASRSRDGSTS